MDTAGRSSDVGASIIARDTCISMSSLGAVGASIVVPSAGRVDRLPEVILDS